MPPSAQPLKKNTYLVNSWADLGIAGGGLSLLLFPFLFFLAGFERSPLAISLALGASYVVNYPHFAATIYRLYHNRENRSTYRFTAYVVPFIFMGLFAIALAIPHSFGSYYTKAFLIWSGYHYSGQTLGISLIYARRSGFPVGVKTRWLLTAAIFSTYLFPIIRAETGPGPFPYFGIHVPSFHIPYFWADLAYGFLVVSWAAFLTFLIFARRLYQRFVPAGIILPILAQGCWYIPGSYAPNFYEFVPLFHGFQYLLIVWVFQMREVKESYEAKKKIFLGWPFALENVKYALALIALGALLFRFIPDDLAGIFGIPLTIAEPLWISTVQLHHFWTDGVIWRLRNRQVGKRLISTPEVVLSRSKIGPLPATIVPPGIAA